MKISVQDDEHRVACLARMDMSQPGDHCDLHFSKQAPLYVSTRSFKSLWQQYRIYPDRIELQCWTLFHTLKIPFHDIVDLQLRPSFSFKDLFPRTPLPPINTMKLDMSDLYRHVVIKKKSGIMRYIGFTPDSPGEFAGIMRLLMDNADNVELLLRNKE